MKKLIISLTLVVSLALVALPMVSLAQTDGVTDPSVTGFGTQDLAGDVGLGDTDLITLVQNIIRIILGLLGLIAVILILYGGFMWMTAAGNDDQITKAKGIMKAAIIGLIVIFAAWAVAEFVISRMMTATGL